MKNAVIKWNETHSGGDVISEDISNEVLINIILDLLLLVESPWNILVSYKTSNIHTYINSEKITDKYCKYLHQLTSGRGIQIKGQGIQNKEFKSFESIKNYFLIELQTPIQINRPEDEERELDMYLSQGIDPRITYPKAELGDAGDHIESPGAFYVTGTEVYSLGELNMIKNNKSIRHLIEERINYLLKIDQYNIIENPPSEGDAILFTEIYHQLAQAKDKSILPTILITMKSTAHGPQHLLSKAITIGRNHLSVTAGKLDLQKEGILKTNLLDVIDQQIKNIFIGDYRITNPQTGSNGEDLIQIKGKWDTVKITTNNEDNYINGIYFSDIKDKTHIISNARKIEGDIDMDNIVFQILTNVGYYPNMYEQYNISRDTYQKIIALIAIGHANYKEKKIKDKKKKK